jgi:hypothetical protein
MPPCAGGGELPHSGPPAVVAAMGRSYRHMSSHDMKDLQTDNLSLHYNREERHAMMTI